MHKEKEGVNSRDHRNTTNTKMANDILDSDNPALASVYFQAYTLIFMAQNNMEDFMGRKILSPKQQERLYLDAYAFLLSAHSEYRKIDKKKLNLADLNYLSKMTVIWTNAGFALELMLKWVASVDGKPILEKHETYKVYNELSVKAKNAVKKVYSGKMSYAIPKGDIEFKAIKLSNKPIQAPDLPQEYYDPTDTLPDLLQFFDKHQLLYGKRYSSMNYDKPEWAMYITNLDPLFSFINGLSRLIKLPNGTWGHENDHWIGFGSTKMLTEQETEAFYKKRGNWKKNKNGHWTQKTKDGIVVVYHPAVYANLLENTDKHVLTKEEPKMFASNRQSREGSYSEPYLIAELFVGY